MIPEEADVVRAIYASFARGSSLRGIAAALSGRAAGDIPADIPTLATRSGRPWNPSSVSAILRNPRYAGWSMLDGVIVRDDSGAPVAGNWEALVPDTLWTDVQARLDDPARKTSTGVPSRPALLTRAYSIP